MKTILTDSNKHVSFYLKDETKFFLYELYFPDEIKTAGCEVLKRLANIPELNNAWNNEQKLAAIEKVHRELSDPTHPISIAMARMRDIPEICIIEGKTE